VKSSAADTYSIVCTEACTCPGGATTGHNFSGFQHNLSICFVDTAASHAQFTITFTINTNAASARSTYLEGFEYSGLAAGSDGPSASAAFANTVNFTTANANEFAFSYGSDQAISVAPAGSNTQISQVLFADPGFGYQVLDMTQNTAAARSCTANFSSGSSGGITFVAVIAFVPSGGSPTPVTHVVQTCSVIGASSVVGQAHGARFGQGGDLSSLASIRAELYRAVNRELHGAVPGLQDLDQFFSDVKAEGTATRNNVAKMATKAPEPPPPTVTQRAIDLGKKQALPCALRGALGYGGYQAVKSLKDMVSPVSIP